MSDAEPSEIEKLPAGYRQGFITSITVALTAMAAFFRFIVLDPDSGRWTSLGILCAVVAGMSLLVLLFSLWRALQPEDERLDVYRVTLRCFATAIVLFVCSFAADVVASLIY